jgi:hypothetical protein
MAAGENLSVPKANTFYYTVVLEGTFPQVQEEFSSKHVPICTLFGAQ